MSLQSHEAGDVGRFEATLRALPVVDRGTPQILHQEVQPGLSLLSTDLSLTKPLVIDAETFPAVCLSVVLSGHARSGAGPIETGFQPGEAWISSTNERVATRKVVLPSHPVRTVELVVTPDWFEAVEGRFGSDSAFDAMRAATGKAITTQRRALDPRLRELALSIQYPPGHGVAAALYFESRALDLLAVLMGDFGARYVETSHGHRRSSLDRMMAVRDLIDQAPGAEHTIHGLAHTFGISASKLKQDFSASFGIGIGRYITERRLQFGRELIESHALSIAEAAYRAGYAHPANFTAAFKRHFGHPPSAVRRLS
jgi:AraC-like DNA-binding protein